LRKKMKSTTSRAGRKPTHIKCTKHGCNKPHYAKGLCASHYQKQRRDAQLGQTKKSKKKGKAKRTAKKKR